MQQDRNDFIQAFKQHLDINLTPAGQWKLDKGKKAPQSQYSTHRKNHLEWQGYKDDNMAKHYLHQEQRLRSKTIQTYLHLFRQTIRQVKLILIIVNQLMH